MSETATVKGRGRSKKPAKVEKPESDHDEEPQVEEEVAAPAKAKKGAPKRKVAPAAAKVENNAEEEPEPSDDGAAEAEEDAKTATPPKRGRKAGATKKTANGSAEPKEEIVPKRGTRVRKEVIKIAPEDLEDDTAASKKAGRSKRAAAPAPAKEEKPKAEKKPAAAAVASKKRGNKKTEETPVEEEDSEETPEEEVEKAPKRGRGNKNIAVVNPIVQENDPQIEKNGVAGKKGRGGKKEKETAEAADAEEVVIPAKRSKTGSTDSISTDKQKTNVTVKRGKSAASENKKPPAQKLNSITTNYLALTFDEPPGKDWNLKVSTWNVAGLRAWIEKDGLKFIEHEKPDIMCLQETKCIDDDLPEAAKIPGYHPYYLCKSKGYAGVAIYSKIMPYNIQYGIGSNTHDIEGRVLTAEYEKFFLVCVYVPNSGRKLVNLDSRMEWDTLFHAYLKDLDTRKPVILCGDMNVSHNEIDLARPKSNVKNAGFTIEERNNLTTLFTYGFIDSYRHLYPDRKDAYTFWSYMGGARAKNIGWRLDYFIISDRIASKIAECAIRDKIMGSDHCPITLFLKM